MTRRRTLVGAGFAVLLAAVVAVLLLATGGGDDGPRRPGPVAGAYARTWEATCVALRSDADRTTATVRARLAGGASTAERRTVARRVVAPFLGRVERRLRRVAGAVPPPEWRVYHTGARGRLDTAAARTRSAQERVRGGDLQALSTLAVADLARAADAPEDLRRLTPACRSAGAV
ncbi:hypothetical protein [Patulibacter minatonensis]|uniref:hypothetical protein n=1 Tax=Patulibacter minatonensis TaxID=298163 RepID=UPI00047EF5B7|nr:hypothetical protein [Patulibacter minatonensis]